MDEITTPLAKEVFEVLCDYTSRPTPPILLKLNQELALKVQELEVAKYRKFYTSKHDHTVL